jgi:hypothetical protein
MAVSVLLLLHGTGSKIIFVWIKRIDSTAVLRAVVTLSKLEGDIVVQPYPSVLTERLPVNILIC